MRHIIIGIVIFFAHSDRCFEVPNPKIVGLVAGRNERIMIKQCLQALALHVDAIVYLDDASDDETVALVKEIAESCRVQRIIEKKVWYRDEPGDKNLLLEAGRAIGGTHFVMIDVDELFTANCAENQFLRNKIIALKPGDRLFLTWIQLWRTPFLYRHDRSIWTNNYKDFIFCDNGTAEYSSEFIHTKRTPQGLHGDIFYIEGQEYGVLHCQFINWRNLLIKQAWYRCLEHIRLPQKPTHLINALYEQSIDETDCTVLPVPHNWFQNYDFFDPTIFEQKEEWREKQILGWFEEYGKDYFSKLDIWDIFQIK